MSFVIRQTPRYGAPSGEQGTASLGSRHDEECTIRAAESFIKINLNARSLAAHGRAAAWRFVGPASGPSGPPSQLSGPAYAFSAYANREVGRPQNDVKRVTPCVSESAH